MGKTFRNTAADLEDILNRALKERVARERKEQRLLKEYSRLVQELTEQPLSESEMLAKWG